MITNRHHALKYIKDQAKKATGERKKALDDVLELLINGYEFGEAPKTAKKPERVKTEHKKSVFKKEKKSDELQEKEEKED